MPHVSADIALTLSPVPAGSVLTVPPVSAGRRKQETVPVVPADSVVTVPPVHSVLVDIALNIPPAPAGSVTPKPAVHTDSVLTVSPARSVGSYCVSCPQCRFLPCLLFSGAHTEFSNGGARPPGCALHAGGPPAQKTAYAVLSILGALIPGWALSGLK